MDALLNAASTADLIVVGTHGRRAADTLPRDAFEHIVLVRHGGDVDQTARACAEHLAGIAGGRVIDGGPATHCEAGVMERASLVVMATGSDRPSWSITDPVARVLGACQRPVLFIPAQ